MWCVYVDAVLMSVFRDLFLLVIFFLKFVEFGGHDGDKGSIKIRQSITFYFLLDWDIKKFVKKDIGLNHWPKSKLHYIYGRSREGSEIPEFGRIQKHTIK